MKIIIDSPDAKLKFSLPLSASKIILPFIKNEELKLWKPIILKSLKLLRKHVKLNGHFTLVEVTSEDTYVKIII